ncbi:MAG: hypothetical protein HC927_04830 [Deltaproteobacteria bacterium]|nr:hypothetical protein [Deltaproteobacteria bacterium]
MSRQDDDPTIESPSAVAPAERERLTTRQSFVYLLRKCSSLSLTELSWLIATGPLTLGAITVQELREGTRKDDDEVQQLIRIYFQRHPKAAVPAIFFARLLDVPRWQAQRLTAQLAREGVLERSGTRSNNRYRRAASTGGDRRA